MALSPFTATVSDSAEEGYCLLRLDYICLQSLQPYILFSAKWNPWLSQIIPPASNAQTAPLDTLQNNSPLTAETSPHNPHISVQY